MGLNDFFLLTNAFLFIINRTNINLFNWFNISNLSKTSSLNREMSRIRKKSAWKLKWDFKNGLAKIWIVNVPNRIYFQGLHTVSFGWFLFGLEWILNLQFCLLKHLMFYQKLLWNIRSRLNSSAFWVFEPVFKYVWSKSSFFVHKASILIKHI